MLAVSLQEIAIAVCGELVGDNHIISSVSIDTRCLQADALYIAIKGEYFDGHDFITEAEKQGACAVICEYVFKGKLSHIIVNDTHLALAQLAALIRAKSSVRVCAVTGSNGKTTVKEMITTLLSQTTSVLATQGNLNNDIGVPLTLLNLCDEHEFAVIEMGANHRGEIAYSSHYTVPDVALINNIGTAHLEGFGSIEGVAEAKSEILAALPVKGTAILNADDAFFKFCLAKAAGRKCLSFGFSEHADVRAENSAMELTAHGFRTYFNLCFKQQRVVVQMSLAGEHNIKNALAASAACLALGINLDTIGQGLQTLNQVQGRMQWLRGKSGVSLIDDSYNANPTSLQAALAVLQQIKQETWLILGEFAELGEQSPALHSQMGVDIKAAGVTRLFTTGLMTQYTVSAFGERGVYFSSQAELITAVQRFNLLEIVILVKGSRAQKMEKVLAAF